MSKKEESQKASPNWRNILIALMLCYAISGILVLFTSAIYTSVSISMILFAWFVSGSLLFTSIIFGALAGE